MTEPTYPLELLRAELGRAISDLKVDLMERFASKRDIEVFRQDFAQHLKDDESHFREINEKLDALIGEKKEREGAEKERSTVAVGRALWLGLVATVGAGLIGAVSTLVAFAIWH